MCNESAEDFTVGLQNLFADGNHTNDMKSRNTEF